VGIKRIITVFITALIRPHTEPVYSTEHTQNLFIGAILILTSIYAYVKQVFSSHFQLMLKIQATVVVYYSFRRIRNFTYIFSNISDIFTTYGNINIAPLHYSAIIIKLNITVLTNIAQKARGYPQMNIKPVSIS
jgi:hypothetical protein